MCRFGSKKGLALCLLLLSCGGHGKGAAEHNPEPRFTKQLLLGDFSGEQAPECGALRITQEKKIVALFELGMNGLSLGDYRACYRREFLK